METTPEFILKRVQGVQQRKRIRAAGDAHKRRFAGFNHRVLSDKLMDALYKATGVVGRMRHLYEPKQKKPRKAA
jgi:hypothetical protein